MPPPPQNAGPNPPAGDPVTANSRQSQLSTESLGDKTIEGIELEGKRTTTTFPAGGSMGNDRPVKVITEEWTAPGSAMPPFRKTGDLRVQVMKRRHLTDIVRGEPDPSCSRSLRIIRLWTNRDPLRSPTFLCEDEVPPIVVSSSKKIGSRLTHGPLPTND